MDSFVVNVVVWILVWPELVLTIDSIEADVRCVALTVGKSSNLTSPVSRRAIHINTYKAFIFVKAEDLFAEHTLQNVFIRKSTCMTF